MKKHSAGLYILCALFLSANLFASPITVSAEGGNHRDILGTGTDYTAILYDSSNGLPTSEANAIVQSEDGFIWLGGYSGLIAYDGTTFTRFDSSTGISSVFSLYVDSRDCVWIGTNENGIACFDHGDMRVYGRVEGLKSYSIRAMTEDSSGNILIATTQGMAYVGSDMELHVINDPLVNKEYITELQTASDGRVFGLTLDGALFEVKDLQIIAFYEAQEFNECIINSIYPVPDRSGELYLGTTGSDVVTAKLGKTIEVKQIRSIDPQQNVNCMLMFDDRLWVSCTNGIGFFDENGEYQEVPDLPMNNTIGNIMEDHEGNLWFTSTRQGVLKLVPDRFTDISAMADMDPVVVNSTCVRSGWLYLGTDRGLRIISLGSMESRENDLTQMLDGVRIRCIYKDSEDNLWICTHGSTGLICYTPNGGISSFNHDNGLDAGRVRTVMQRADGSMVAATGDGVFIIRDGEVTEHYAQEQGINNTEILSVAEGPDGRLYLGSDGDGIYVIDGDRVSLLGIEDGLTSEVIMRIKWDPKRELFWLITSNSIEYMKDDVIKDVSNFPYSNNYDIYFDDDDGAWILSSNGIYITNVDSLLANDHIEYSFYNTRSGLPYITTGNSRSYLSEEGMLYISGTTGVCRVNINADETGNANVKLAIPSIYVDDKLQAVKSDTIVRLPAGSRRLTINAYAVTFGLSNPRITYQLDGFDQSPTQTTKQDLQPITYTNLDGGRYDFHLNVIDDKTGQVEKTITLSFIKEGSIYETVWFWVVLMVIVMAIISGLIYVHFRKATRELMEQQAQDELFIEQILRTFTKCIDMRDKQNQGHSFRVAYYTRMLAEKLAPKRGYTEKNIKEFHSIALLHDIGKISIPDQILNKTERLNDQEYAIMKSHAAAGEKILKDVDIVENLAVGAGCHHERIDGRGYPRGLKGEEIPEVARIIAVADTFDAMFSTRPYRKQMLLEDVLAELNRSKGSQLEAEVVDALNELAEEKKLDKEAVERAIEQENEEVFSRMNQESVQEKTAKENEAFMESLGLATGRKGEGVNEDEGQK